MSQPKILTVFGTRPEAIKMAPVVRVLQHSDDVIGRVCVTGQHRDMLDDVLNIFDITPHHDLNVMTPNQSLGALTSRILTGLEDILSIQRPDLVLVHGDTTSCMAATLAAFYAGIPVGHVEAGLRTGDMSAPFPEEANRAITDRLCSLLFAPTTSAKENLVKEGIDPTTITVTGNTVIDALIWMRQQVRNAPPHQWRSVLGPAYSHLNNANARTVLVTGHRRENLGDGFLRICKAIATLARRHPNVHFIYPVHLNPNVQKPVHEHLGNTSNIHLISPLTYAPFVHLLDSCDLVLTDSGGIQEEAPALGKPVVVMRELTERPEAVAAGTVVLVGTDEARIVDEVHRLLTESKHYDRMSQAHNPYGDGHAAEKILSTCLDFLR